MAAVEADRIGQHLGANLIRVEHIGSTSVPGLHAKPIIDLMPLVRDISAVDDLEAALETAGYNWYGEYGIAGRRYLNRDQPDHSRRIANIHIFQVDAPESERHLAFRDYLRSRTDLVQDYATLKLACAAQCQDDIGCYMDCKDGWIKKIETEAVSWYRAVRGT